MTGPSGLKNFTTSLYKRNRLFLTDLHLYTKHILNTAGEKDMLCGFTNYDNIALCRKAVFVRWTCIFVDLQDVLIFWRSAARTLYLSYYRKEFDMSWIECKDLQKIYKSGDLSQAALDHVDFRLEKGEYISIVGRSGSGKSTLMNILGLIDTPTKGSIFINNEDVLKYTDKKPPVICRHAIRK